MPPSPLLLLLLLLPLLPPWFCGCYGQWVRATGGGVVGVVVGGVVTPPRRRAAGANSAAAGPPSPSINLTTVDAKINRPSAFSTSCSTRSMGGQSGVVTL